MANTLSAAPYFSATSALVTSTKSVNVFIFLSSLPSSYQARPISWPPRMCAMAMTKPRSSRLTHALLKLGSVEMP